VEKGQLKQWNVVAANLPGRTNKDCRKRWAKLDSNINKGAWSSEEDEKLQAAVQELGCRYIYPLSAQTKFSCFLSVGDGYVVLCAVRLIGCKYRWTEIAKRVITRNADRGYSFPKLIFVSLKLDCTEETNNDYQNAPSVGKTLWIHPWIIQSGEMMMINF
jgi:hypothetical protein